MRKRTHVWPAGRDYVAEADRIVREGRERIAKAKADQTADIFAAVRDRKPILIFGVEYVPAEEAR